jgi:hypothetical protein
MGDMGKGKKEEGGRDRFCGKNVQKASGGSQQSGGRRAKPIPILQSSNPMPFAQSHPIESGN